MAFFFSPFSHYRTHFFRTLRSRFLRVGLSLEQPAACLQRWCPHAQFVGAGHGSARPHVSSSQCRRWEPQIWILARAGSGEGLLMAFRGPACGCVHAVERELAGLLFSSHGDTNPIFEGIITPKCPPPTTDTLGLGCQHGSWRGDQPIAPFLSRLSIRSSRDAELSVSSPVVALLQVFGGLGVLSQNLTLASIL